MKNGKAERRGFCPYYTGPCWVFHSGSWVAGFRGDRKLQPGGSAGPFAHSPPTAHPGEIRTLKLSWRYPDKR